MVKLYREQGLNWLAIAEKLNEAGFRASRGGAFQAVQVQRLYQRVTFGLNPAGCPLEKT